MIKIKEIKPVFDGVLTTMDKYEGNENEGVIITKIEGAVKEYQKVLAIGSAVREVAVGDLVEINPSRYAVKKWQDGSLKDGVVTENPVMRYNFNTVEVDGKECLLLHQNDIEFVIKRYDGSL